MICILYLKRHSCCCVGKRLRSSGLEAGKPARGSLNSNNSKTDSTGTEQWGSAGVTVPPEVILKPAWTWPPGCRGWRGWGSILVTNEEIRVSVLGHLVLTKH